MKILKNYEEEGIWKESAAFGLNVLFFYLLKTLGKVMKPLIR